MMKKIIKQLSVKINSLELQSKINSQQLAQKTKDLSKYKEMALKPGRQPNLMGRRTSSSKSITREVKKRIQTTQTPSSFFNQSEAVSFSNQSL